MIKDRFAYQRDQKHPKTPLRYFNKKIFKKKNLNFIIINNISFYMVCSPAFKEIIEYLRE
jgi:hypothetical protein